MPRTKVVNNGSGQAVSLPPAYRFDAEEVFINKIGDTVMLTPIAALGKAFHDGMAMITEDFMKDGMPEELPSSREEL